MSGALTALATVGTFALPALSATDLVPAWIRQGRKIGKIIPDVTIEEQHQDRLQVTQHPIADGTPISDHAFRLPATLTMRCGWSNANIAGAAVGGFMQGGISGAASGAFSSLTESRAKEIYQQLRELQGTRVGDISPNPQSTTDPVLVDITTGKREYKNMALIELSVSTDHTKEYSLFVEAHFQEVFRVTTRTTSQPATTDMEGGGSKTAQTTDEPSKQADPKDQHSILGNLTGRDIVRKTATGTPGVGFARPLPPINILPTP